MASPVFRNTRHGYTAIISGYAVTDTRKYAAWCGYDPSTPFRVERLDHDSVPMDVVGDFADLPDAVAAIDHETSILRLEVSMCRERQSYTVIFEGPDADTMAIEYMDRTAVADKAAGYEHGNRAFHEIPGYPYDAEKFGKVYERLNPICEHGLSANLCYGPAHYAREDEVASGW